MKRCGLTALAYLAVATATMPGLALAQEQLVSQAADAFIPAATAVIAVDPVVLPAPGRGQNLHLRVSAPVAGHDLPVIVFAHGNALSSRDYAPLVDFWASHGFVVIQPTFLDSETLHLRPDDPRTPLIWRFRVEDMKRVLDDLDIIEAFVPGLEGRIDRKRIVAAGHSYGGITAAMVLGAQVIGPDGKKEDLSDPRFRAGVLLSTAGNGGKDLSPFAADHFPFMNPSFVEMVRPAIVFAGDQDQSPLTTRGPDWFADPYALSSKGKCLVTLFGAKHGLGGISGYGVAVTTDESPARVEQVQKLSWAYLRGALYPGDPAWPAAQAALKTTSPLQGRVSCK